MRKKAILSAALAFALLVLIGGIPTESAQALVPFTMAGGTWWDRDVGETGTSFVWDPIVPGVGTIELIDIIGPPGWNSNQPFECGRYQPPGIAGNRAMC